MKHDSSFILVLIAVSLSSCVAIPRSAQIQLEKPVDCVSARLDIENLEKMKASSFRQKAAMVSLISPLGFAINLFTNDINNRAEVANGQYNNRIDTKITSIKYVCQIEDLPEELPPE